MARQNQRFIAGIALAAIAISPMQAQAAPPDDVADLVGARGAGGETQLEARGYTFVDVTKGDERAYANWWNGSKKRCITVVTYDGRYQSIDKASASDCKQKSGDNGTAVAVAVGAAALIGALALAHKSHHHEGGAHGGNEQQEAAYDRGYRDGLYNCPYHNYDRSDFYSQGYQVGVQQRDYDGSHRPGQGGGGGGGYREDVYVQDLIGQARNYSEGELGRRGFSQIETYTTGGDGRFTTYWRQTSKQCISVNTRNQRVFDITTLRNKQCRN